MPSSQQAQACLLKGPGLDCTLTHCQWQCFVLSNAHAPVLVRYHEGCVSRTMLGHVLCSRAWSSRRSSPHADLLSLYAGRQACAGTPQGHVFVWQQGSPQLAAGPKRVTESLLVGRAALASVGGASAPFGMRSRLRAAARACSQDDLTSASVSLLP